MESKVWKLVAGSILMVLSAGFAIAQEPKNFAVWGGFFKPFSEHLNGDWVVGADWKHKERLFLGLRYFRCKDKDTDARGKGLTVLVGSTFLIDKGSFQQEGIAYRIGVGVGFNRLEVSGKRRTHRGIVEVFVEARTKRNLSVRLISSFGGLDGNSGWSIVLGWQF